MMITIFVLLLSLFHLCLSGPVPSMTKRDTAKYVFAHFMIGNVYSYTLQDWESDITLAHQSGIDAFALNVGSDSWESGQVALAYQAAQQSGTGLKLFLSFDMTSLPCGSAGDAAALRNYITTYASHPSQFIYNGQVFVSTFSGESCLFGQNDAESGWKTQFIQQLTGGNTVYFVPSFFVAPSSFHMYQGIINGMFNWNSAWPTQVTANSLSNFSINSLLSLSTDVGSTNTDQQYISALAPMGASYMAAASAWFFTHYSPQTYNKNWIYLSDDHLYAKRWEEIINIRQQIQFVQAVSWNDYGESHYLGPIKGNQPNSQAWVDGFDHTGWLDLTLYYATAFKTGKYPPVTKDKIVMWSRSHPGSATAPDSVGRPTNWQITLDFVWVIVLATSPGSVTLSTSPTQSQTFQVPSGATKLSIPIAAGGFMSAVLERDGKTVINLKPENFVFNPNPPSYNFNALVVASP